MKTQYLGDSYDIVKRYWAERLAGIAPLFAHPKFVPNSIKDEFEKMVVIPVIQSDAFPKEPFGLFLDPDTGIPLPTASAQKTNTSHAPLSFIAEELNRLKPIYLICFDQSHDRNCGLSAEEQRNSKMTALRGMGIASFYYVSHASFLFAAKDAENLELIRRELVENGIPEWRLIKPE